MIVTCASCLTKFQLDDSKISDKGAKVRCSRCKHVFYVAPPPETKEEVFEKLDSFEKYHEELLKPGQGEAEVPSRVKEEARPAPAEEEERFVFTEERSAEKMEEGALPGPSMEERSAVGISKPMRMARSERRGPSLFFAILVALVLLAFGLFYLWTESGYGGKVYSPLEYPIQKATELWAKIWGAEREGLIIKDLNRYDERIGETPLLVIEGKLDNQSRFTKKLVKVKVTIYGEKRAKLAEKETVCGRVISQEELRNLPETFFKGEMMIRPKTEKEMVVPPKKVAPFMVVFKNLSATPKEFLVEIVEAPNL
ncbi:MAG: zinc-ribbon domain-containing protein [Syntrophaceae bacterium]|nr:zinc-ribbon domain-containing protein [Syntrophaceae bacterium]